MGNSYHDNSVGNGSLGREAWLAFHTRKLVQQRARTLAIMYLTHHKDLESRRRDFEGIYDMHAKKRKPSTIRTTRLQADRNGKRSSSRDLTAFGIWAERTDLK